MDVLGLIADIVGIAAALFAGWQALRLRRERQLDKARLDGKIKVSLRSATRKIDLPVELRRREASRAEILGRLGMIPLRDRPKFALPYLNTREFLTNLNDIVQGVGDQELIIRCEENEIDQFDLDKFQHLVSPL